MALRTVSSKCSASVRREQCGHDGRNYERTRAQVGRVCAALMRFRLRVSLKLVVMAWFYVWFSEVWGGVGARRVLVWRLMKADVLVPRIGKHCFGAVRMRGLWSCGALFLTCFPSHNEKCV